MIFMLENKAKLLLKRLRYLIQRWVVAPLQPKSFRDEYQFFTQIKSMAYDDSAYKEALLRSRSHQVDKVLTFENFVARNGMLPGIKELLQEVLESQDHDDATVNWCRQVLAEYQERATGSRPVETTFDLLYDAESRRMLKSIIENRRSIRSFTQQPILKEDINEILASGLWAPTGCNRQMINYLVLDDKEDMKFCQKMAGETYPFPSEAPICVVILVDPRVYALPGHRHMAYLETGAAVQNMLLTARVLGIGGCWLFWQDAAPKHSEFLSRFKLQPWLLPVALVCFGYPAAVPKFPPYRKALSKCVYYPGK
jgi:nitroreductase